MLNHNTFLTWLDSYGQAWKKRDPKAITNIFSEDALYFEKPFKKPFIGKKGIHQYWVNNAQVNQKNVNFGYSKTTVSDTSGLAHWWATFTLVDTGERVEIDGFLMADFNRDMKCTCFREWWHVNENQ